MVIGISTHKTPRTRISGRGIVSKSGSGSFLALCTRSDRGQTGRYGMMLRMVKRSGPRTRDPWNIGMIAVAVAALLFAGYAGVSAATRDNSTDYVSTYVIPEPAKYDYLTVSILGDSYSVGAGATANNGWVPRLARKLCWNDESSAQVSTGYVNSGPEGSTNYVQRAANVAARQPALIIVQGSTNDADRPGVTEAAASTYAALKAGSPGSTIVVVGPTAAPSIDPDAVRRDRDEVSSAARDAGLAFIDPIDLGWLSKPSDYSSDGLHPTNAGHEQIALLLRDQLTALSIPRVNACDPIN